MVLVKIQEKWEINSITHFVEEFKLQNLFKKLFKCSIEDWDHDISDEECIDELLQDLPNNYLLIFIEDSRTDGYFVIIKL